MRVALKALNALGRPGEAWAEAEGLLRSPYLLRVPEVRLEAARAATALGRLDDGIREMRRYLERDSGAHGAWGILSRMYNAAERPAEAADARTNA